MTLLELLLQELPKRGGWPEEALTIAQDIGGAIYGYKCNKPYTSGGMWRSVSGKGLLSSSILRDAGLADDRMDSFVTREQYEAALQQPVWNGEGLPPVGCKFEYGSHRTAATCLGVGFDMVFAWKGNPLGEDYEEFMISIKDSSFHAPRTDAERKREAFGNALYQAINWNSKGEYPSDSRLEDYRKAYDAIEAGKIPGVKLDV